jgi:hypothetical protein
MIDYHQIESDVKALAERAEYMCTGQGAVIAGSYVFASQPMMGQTYFTVGCGLLQSNDAVKTAQFIYNRK